MAAITKRKLVSRDPLLIDPAVANFSPRFSPACSKSRRNSSTIRSCSLRLNVNGANCPSITARGRCFLISLTVTVGPKFVPVISNRDNSGSR